MINVQLSPGAPITQMDEAQLWRRDGSVEDANEHTTWVEYWVNWATPSAACVHRSVHVTLKKGLAIEGVTGGLGG